MTKFNLSIDLFTKDVCDAVDVAKALRGVADRLAKFTSQPWSPYALQGKIYSEEGKRCIGTWSVDPEVTVGLTSRLLDQIERMRPVYDAAARVAPRIKAFDKKLGAGAGFFSGAVDVDMRLMYEAVDAALAKEITADNDPDSRVHCARCGEHVREPSSHVLCAVCASEEVHP